MTTPGRLPAWAARGLARDLAECQGCSAAEDEDDDQDYNGRDADNTYTLSQESNEEDILVVHAKSKEQEAKEKRRKKFLEVLSYFDDLLTDEDVDSVICAPTRP